MILKDIDLFFIELDKEMRVHFSVIVTGAAAGLLVGAVRRPTDDIDFEVKLPPNFSEKFAVAVRRVSQRLGIAAQYSENIAGWSQIAFLNYRQSSRLYKKIGKIEVRLIALENWTIGKMARYYPLDRIDIFQALKHKPISSHRIIAFWARALKASALSDRSKEFSDHVEDFLRTNGKKLWGKSFDVQKAIQQFKKNGRG